MSALCVTLVRVPDLFFETPFVPTHERLYAARSDDEFLFGPFSGSSNFDEKECLFSVS